MKDLSSIVAKFKVQGTIEEIKPLGAGLINDTYKVNTKEADAPDYVLQRINHAIFQNVEFVERADRPEILAEAHHFPECRNASIQY